VSAPTERTAQRAGDRALVAEVAARRTFAIISHPDAGKTTLTEKFLLYAGAVHEAGAVKSRKVARAATSDWMKLEQERGISISSTVLHFAYGPWRFNLLDTPGHADFSEDTYRTLCAADAAVMVLDIAKGLEPQTLKLFKVCRDRGIPIVTFVNKCDRPGLPPLAILDEISDQIGLEPVPLVWPVADGPEFGGVVDRRTREFVTFGRSAHGSKEAEERRVPLDEADRAQLAPQTPELRWDAAMEEVELLDLEGRELDGEAFLAGKQTPVFFGSALANFGVRQLLEGFAELAPAPGPQPLGAPEDAPARPVTAPFSAMVFKIQANMDPRHRDRVAFLRVQSGRFSRGMSATHARTGRAYQLKYAHQLFAQDRETVDDAVAGDVVGVVNASDLLVGDSLWVDEPAVFPAIPTFAPERFTVARNRDTSRYKQFRRGLAQLDEEGVVHVLRRPEYGDQEPILAGVGQLQFEVAEHRMREEFGAEVVLSPAPWQLARLVVDGDVSVLRGQRGTVIVEDAQGRTLALFNSEHALSWAMQDHPEMVFGELGLTRS
jgi:peptide chain release factor 3